MDVRKRKQIIFAVKFSTLDRTNVGLVITMTVRK